MAELRRDDYIKTTMAKRLRGHDGFFIRLRLLDPAGSESEDTEFKAVFREAFGDEWIDTLLEEVGT